MNALIGGGARPPAEFVVERPGLRTTVQDLGRYGYARFGVGRSGAADWLSAALANRLVRNPGSAAVLEITLRGPRLRVTEEVIVAVTGAAVDLLVDGVRAPLGRPIAVPAGASVQIGTARRGLRSYLAVRGGFAVPPVLGSRSTDTLSGLGPPPLGAGDRLPVGTCPDRWKPPTPAWSPSRPSAHPSEDSELTACVFGNVVRYLPETPDGSGLAGAYVVSSDSDRVGVRLVPSGRPRADGGELPTQGMVAGAIQVPPSGEPIVLLADHAVTGGYRVGGVVIRADLPLVAQARPGERIELFAVDEREAREALRSRHALLDRLLSN